MAKASMYVANVTDTTVLANGIVPLGNIVKRPCNRNILLSGSTITLTDSYQNYYEVTVSATFEGTAAGVVELVLQQNGIPVIGGSATETVADENTYSISFTSIVRATSGCVVDQLQLINAGISANYTNTTVSITKL